jgi:hypothetical protein
MQVELGRIPHRPCRPVRLKDLVVFSDWSPAGARLPVSLQVLTIRHDTPCLRGVASGFGSAGVKGAVLEKIGD